MARRTSMVSESGVAKPVKPRGLDTPGLKYRQLKDGWDLRWLPRSDLVERGYPKTTYRLWSSTALTPSEPTREEWEEISARCERLQSEMLRSVSGGDKADTKFVFDGMIKSLSRLYQTHEESKFKTLRYQV